MSTENNPMFNLLKQQEQERKDLDASAYLSWQYVQEAENKLLSPYDGNYGQAPQEVKDIRDKRREEYFNEWGSEGTLLKLMNDKHAKQREFVAKREQILADIRISQQRNKQKGNEQ